MSGAVVQDEDWDKLEHSGRFNSVMSYPFWKERGTDTVSGHRVICLLKRVGYRESAFHFYVEFSFK